MKPSNMSDQSNGLAISARGLTRVYGAGNTAVYALRGINLDVAQGEWIGVKGRSGSGKTTLLNCVSGLDRPTQGDILCFGQNITKFSDDPKYVEQVINATKIYLEDMPTIVLAEELHVIPANYTYWKGFPNSEDPYVAPFPCWRDIFLMTLKLQPV